MKDRSRGSPDRDVIFVPHCRESCKSFMGRLVEQCKGLKVLLVGTCILSYLMPTLICTTRLWSMQRWRPRSVACHFPWNECKTVRFFRPCVTVRVARALPVDGIVQFPMSRNSACRVFTVLQLTCILFPRHIAVLQVCSAVVLSLRGIAFTAGCWTYEIIIIPFRGPATGQCSIDT